MQNICDFPQIDFINYWEDRTLYQGRSQEGKEHEGVGVVRRSLESWWRQPTFWRAYADHLSLRPRARRVLVWVTVWQPPTGVLPSHHEPVLPLLPTWEI